MPITPFKLERFFARYEFKVKYLLSSSDVESLGMDELLALAEPASREMWETLKLGYTESQGHPLLRAEIARQYVRITPEQVLVAAPEEAIFVAMQTLLTPGDEVIVISPAYQSLYAIAQSIGCVVKPWVVHSGSSGWELDMAALERLFSPRTRLLVINFPHNPTGVLPLAEEFETIVSLARQRNCYIFSDEMYRRLEYDPAQRLPAVCEVYEKGISLSGLSKAFALPGLRIGWLAAQESGLMERWLAYKDYTTICSSAPGEILALIALQNAEWIVQRNLEIIRHNTTLAAAFCQRHARRFAWLAPRAGSIAFPRWLGAKRVEDFCQQVLDECGVMIVPGSIFDYPGSHFRLGLGRKNFGEALEQVENWISGTVKI